MNISIINKHKSINPPAEFELPDFSVITGKNGSGKTHLLETIVDGSKSNVVINNKTIKNIKYIPFNGLNPVISEHCDPNSITQFIKNVWNKYVQARAEGNGANQSLANFFNRISDDSAVRFIQRTIQDTKKNFHSITEDDLRDCFNLTFMGNNDLFTAQFALLFKNFHLRQEENNINQYYQSKGLPTNSIVLTNQEFKEKFGNPPWDFVNNILLQTGIPYEVNSPIGTRHDSNFNLILKDRTSGFEISSKDLSTGEKVLMSLALAIYNTLLNQEKPEILIIDEPDAGLHPSMSKMMVDILNKNIVGESNIPVIITTHSPTTVISSEGISIYQLERGNSVPFKIPVQRAVEILSSDIPFLKISTEKRRQVIVESKYDVNYFELITNILSRTEKLSIEPIFIPARTSNGSNCTDVKELVNSLSENGNDQIYGIIDWDSTNRSQGRIIVLGENERYAIENYLLDPLLMGLLFIRERKLKLEEFGLLSIKSYPNVDKLTQNDGQLIINKILNDLGLLTTNTSKYKLMNGWELDISSEFNSYNGHELETTYKAKYPFLKAYHREDELKKCIIEKVMDDYPQYIPNTIFETIKKIK
jgi:predicted ATPase